jgi:hypothetical protein
VADNIRGKSDIELAEGAARGDPELRKAMSALAHPMVLKQTGVFCKRFCHSNHFHYSCTLFSAWGRTTAEVPLCEWGNGSYAWMLDDLTKSERLLRFEGRSGSSLKHYLSTIINSQPFYERWKNWRFNRRVRVPVYIQRLGQNAVRLFFELSNGDTLANIAQRIGLDLLSTQRLAKEIIAELARRNKLYLLDPPKTASLTGYHGMEDGDEDALIEADIPDSSLDPEKLHENRKLAAGWEALTPVEQFVLESLVVDELDANEVLEALNKMNISIKEGVPPSQTDRQQLYYFRRKALAKLADNAGFSKGDSNKFVSGFKR